MLFCLWSHAICLSLHLALPPTHTLSWWGSLTTCCEAGAVILCSLSPRMPAHMQAHRHMHTHVHTCLQRLSCEAEVTGLWFHATLSKCSANCHPSLLESNRDPTWATRGPQDRVISLAMWEERTTKGCSPWYMSHLNKIHEQNNQGFNSTVYSASTHELAFGSRPRVHGEVGVVSMTAD